MEIHKRLDIQDSDTVLEVGSGNEPYWRSDVLLDRYLEDREGWRYNQAIVADDRLLLIADALNPPFRGKFFDYVIANHVIEHVDDLGAFAESLEALAPKGFIGCPSSLYEKMKYPATHLWYIDRSADSGDLLFCRKTGENHPENYFGDLFGGRYFKQQGPLNPLSLMYAKYRDLFFIEHEWQGRIKYRIVQSPMAYGLEELNRVMRLPGRITLLDAAAIYAAQYRHGMGRLAMKLIDKAKSLSRGAPAARNPAAVREKNRRIMDSLICPACKSRPERTNDALACPGCRVRYPIVGNMIVFCEDQMENIRRLPGVPEGAKSDAR